MTCCICGTNIPDGKLYYNVSPATNVSKSIPNRNKKLAKEMIEERLKDYTTFKVCKKCTEERHGIDNIYKERSRPKRPITGG